jgi:uncharacterized protein (DUF305 family)
MKTVILKKSTLLAGLILCCSLQIIAQDSADTSKRNPNTSDSAQYSDTGFVNNAIKQHIVEYKVAEMALKNAGRPKIKELARHVMENDREALAHLLTKNKAANVEGVSQKDLDAIMKSTGEKKEYKNSEQIPQGVTGNTPNEDLGSGSSGSGNVHGDDTGTIARTHSTDDNANYSEQGEYAYNSKSFLADMETLDKQNGNDFENQWLNMVLQMQNTKIKQFNSAVEHSRNDEIRAAALAAIPRAKMLRDNVMRVMKNRPPARSIDPTGQKKMGDDNINRKNAR